MRIGIDARSLMEPHPSGIGVYTACIIQALIQLAPQYEYVLFTCGRRLVHTPSIRSLQRYHQVKWVHVSWPNKLYHLAGKVGLAPRIDRVLGGIDVLFVPNWHIVPRSASVPTVLTVHDLSYRLYAEHLSLRRRIWHWYIAPQKLVRSADHLIAVSNQTAQDLISHMDVPAEKITVIHSAAPKATTTESAALSDMSLPKRYALALATLEPRKNLAALLDAFGLFRERFPRTELELVIAGPVGWKSGPLLRRIERQPYVRYLGYISESQKSALIRQARLVAYVSIYEGFGFPILEAFQAGVPVLAAQAGAIPEVAGTAALLVDPYSGEDIASGLQSLDANEPLRQLLRERMTTQIQQYKWSTAAERTLTVLRQVLE